MMFGWSCCTDLGPPTKGSPSDIALTHKRGLDHVVRSPLTHRRMLRGHACGHRPCQPASLGVRPSPLPVQGRQLRAGRPQHGLDGRPAVQPLGLPEGHQTGRAGSQELPHLDSQVYGSVGVSGYDVGTTDGMNEKGFSGNMLWLAESEFGRRDEGRPGLCVGQWLQFCLDNFATVNEAVTYFQANDVYNDGTVLVKDSTFTSNYAYNDGGGIYNENMLK